VRIENRTPYLTRDLTALVTRCAPLVFDKEAWRRARRGLVVRFEIARTRHGYCTGRAFVGGKWMVVRIAVGRRRLAFAKYERDYSAVDRGDLAFVVTHELGHIRGLRHAKMRGNLYDRRRLPQNEKHFAFAERLHLRLAPPEPKVPRAVQAAQRRAEKVARARGHVAAWERRRKLATTKLGVWRRRLRDLERRAARAAAAAPHQRRETPPEPVGS
jgi:hypothetical protein